MKNRTQGFRIVFNVFKDIQRIKIRDRSGRDNRKVRKGGEPILPKADQLPLIGLDANNVQSRVTHHLGECANSCSEIDRLRRAFGVADHLPKQKRIIILCGRHEFKDIRTSGTRS